MSALAGLQRAFARAIEAGDDSIGERVRAGSATPGVRIAFYRASVRARRRDALAETYPVVQRLVGEECFSEVARRYYAAHPPRSGDLALFGDRFADFLAADPDAQRLPYLGDVARLEWACHESFHAADAGPLDAVALASVAAERQGEVRLALHPSVRLVESCHAIAAIHEANQPGRDGTLSRAAGPDRVLVHRTRALVRVRSVEAHEWALLRAIEGGATLEEAAAAMGERAAQASLAACLARLAAEDVVAAFSLAADRA